MAVVRGYGDLHLRGRDLELAAVYEVLGIQGRVLPVLPAALVAEGLRLLLRHAAALQNVPHLPGGQGQHLGIPALLMLGDALAQLLMDGLHHVIAAIFLQRLPQGGGEHILLLPGGHGRLHPEHRVNDLLVDLLCVFAVVEGVIDIGRPVVEGGEQESQLRSGGDMAGGGAVKAAVLTAVFQLQGRGLDRADAAEDMVVDLIGGVEHFGSV